MSETGFEARLLAQLVSIVEERQASSPAAGPRASRTRLALVLAALAVVAALAATATAAWTVLRGDERKGELAGRVDAGRHIGPLAAEAGAWKLYVAPSAGRVDWELSSPSVQVLGTFTDAEPIESVVSRGSSGAVVAGRVTVPGVRRVVLRRPGGGEVLLPLSAGGYFLRPLDAGDAARVGSALLVALDGAGAELARAPVSAGVG